MADNIVAKMVVSVTEMARMVGLARARFYQLVRRGTFPPADKDPATNRPCYFEEKQGQILDARRRNCGVDGVPILFYSRRRDLGRTKVPPRPTKVKGTNNQYADLIDGLTALGLTVTTAHVEPVVRELYPNGTEGIDLGKIIGAVFRRLRRQDSSGNVQ
jgi:hypothetical protein